MSRQCEITCTHISTFFVNTVSFFPMTKFQRGELMDGWNDCPTLPTLSRESSSSSLSSARSKKRSCRVYGLGSDPGLRRVPTPILSSGPPPMPSSTVVSECEEIDVSSTREKLITMVTTSGLSEQNVSFYDKHLVAVYDTLQPEHQLFISKIVEGLIRKDPTNVLKGSILAYTMNNSGISTWSVPLKKLVETL